MKKLGIETVQDFKGKMVRVTGRVETDSGKSLFLMWVHNHADIELVEEKPSEKQPMPKEEPAPKNAQPEQKVLTGEEALKLRSNEKVTVQFKVVGVDDGVNKVHFRGFYLGPRLFLNGDKCTAVLAPPVQQTIHRLGIDPMKHFTGKVIRVTGVVVQNAPQGPGCYIVVHDLNQFTVVVGE